VEYAYILYLKSVTLSIVKNEPSLRGTDQKRSEPLEINQVHRNNRVLQLNRKGFKPSIKKEKSKVNPRDLFWIKKKQYVCKGMFSYGRYILFGTVKKKEYIKFSEVTKIFHFGSFVWNS